VRTEPSPDHLVREPRRLHVTCRGGQGQRDESILVGAQLAARLGHERVYPMDDHTADSPSADEKAAGAAISKAWDNPATKKRLAASAALE